MVPSQTLAPIALFAYKRADHLKRTLDSLAANPEASSSRLIVFVDGPKGTADQDAVTQVRQQLEERFAGPPQFGEVELNFSDRNKGLAQSVIDGVSTILDRHERIIVLEDDMVLSPHFLKYMNDGLDVYADEQNVASIHGYRPPLSTQTPETFFLKGADCWGWATWRRAWQFFDEDSSALLSALENDPRRDRFSFDGDYAFEKMLRKQANGEIDSWAIRWHAATFLSDLYTLHPGRNLVDNIGVDGSGTHGDNNAQLGASLSESAVVVEPISRLERRDVYEAYRTFYRSLKRRPRPISHLMKATIRKLGRSVSKRLRRKSSPLTFSPPLKSWSEAQNQSSGYDAPAIVERVTAASRIVRDGGAAYERDSVLFNEPDACFPALSCLMTVAAQNNGRLSVLDFGGALGSFFWQHRSWLSMLPALSWCVVEQPQFTDIGQAEFSNDALRFEKTLASACDATDPNVLFLSSVLPYLETPYDLLEEAWSRKIPFVLIDRTPFTSLEEDRVTVQTVPPSIYDAKYPIWLFSEAKFKAALNNRFEIVSEFDALDGQTTASEIGKVHYKGLFLRRISE